MGGRGREEASAAARISRVGVCESRNGGHGSNPSHLTVTKQGAGFHFLIVTVIQKNYQKALSFASEGEFKEHTGRAGAWLGRGVRVFVMCAASTACADCEVHACHPSTLKFEPSLGSLVT